MTISTEDRSKMRAALLEKGVKTRGLTGEDLVAAYKSHCEGTPAPTPSPSPKTPEQPPQTTIEDMTMTNPAPQQTGTQAAQIAQAIEAVLNQHNTPAMDEARIVELIKEHATKKLEITPANAKEPVTIEGAHESFEEVITWLSTGTNVYLVGPAGSGKTTIAIQAAKALGLEFRSTGAIMAAYELLGFRDAHGVYHASQLRDAYENGHLFLFDELDACNAKAINTFNQLLENECYTFPDGVVQKHPDFRVIAGANTVGNGATKQYIGRAPLDGASKNRFVKIEITYDTKIESARALAEYKAHGGTDEQVARNWVSKVQKVRDKLAQIGSQVIVSPRQSMYGCRGLAKGLTEEQVFNATILNELTDDQRQQVQHV